VAATIAVGVDLVGLWSRAAEGRTAVAVCGRCHGEEIVSTASTEASATSVRGRAGWAGWGRVRRHCLVVWCEPTIFQSYPHLVSQRDVG
jgi:hypothetical protein